jgi:hypothetical protein
VFGLRATRDAEISHSNSPAVDGDFGVLPLAVLAKIRAQASAEGGQLRIVVAEHPVGVLADLDRTRWNIHKNLFDATRFPWPTLRPVG